MEAAGGSHKETVRPNSAPATRPETYVGGQLVGGSIYSPEDFVVNRTKTAELKTLLRIGMPPMSPAEHLAALMRWHGYLGMGKHTTTTAPSTTSVGYFQPALQVLRKVLEGPGANPDLLRDILVPATPTDAPSTTTRTPSITTTPITTRTSTTTPTTTATTSSTTSTSAPTTITRATTLNVFAMLSDGANWADMVEVEQVGSPAPTVQKAAWLR